MSRGDHNKGVSFHLRPVNETLEVVLQRINGENATRVPCGHCGALVLPANLARHESYHED